ncbi:hypothetical protein AWC38_SpisGene22668 [Stylophora pistillata]|uniref:ZAD domain-containing protein n=1 Tax=Stylophora pistillata TaxID=50429 RepID=A0A2B4RAF7_STYPI|nr:hypothetical protein AWC38_SpisGene22668 [Stylophora pistillata]
MTSSHVVRTPTKTPTKIYFPRANDYCRCCNENVKINGYSQLNLFTENNRDFLRRFRLVVNVKVENNSKISQVLCKKCYRAVLRYENVLSQSEELQEFRNNYKEVNRDVGELTRRKRCAKDSPCKSPRTARTPSSPATKTFERVRNPKSQRKIISTTNDSAEGDEEAVFVGQPRNASPTEVRIYYPSGLVKKIISAEIDASIVRQICSQEYNGVINSVWKHPELKTKIIDKIYVEINKESSALCSTKDPSILRKTKASDLIEFSDSTCEEELKGKAPILYGCLYNVASDYTKKENERKKARLAAPISLATSILVKQRCPQMSAIAYRFALGVLWDSGAKKKGYVRANHWGISVSHTCTLEKLDEMGFNFDEAVKTWKCELEKNHLINEALEQVAEYVDAKDKEQIPVGCQTTDVSCLSLTFPQTSTNDQNVLCSDVDGQSTNSDLLDMEDFLNDYTEYRESTKDLKSPENDVNCFLINKCGYSESLVDIFNNFVHSQGLEVSTLSKKDVSLLKSSQLANRPKTYQILGDNLDKFVRPKHMSSNNQNKSIHWFAMNAVQDRATMKSTDIKQQQQRPILSVENSEFLPSTEDNNQLLQNFILLVARILVKRVPDFQCLKRTVVKHIPHEFSNEMKRKSVQVPLGILFKNENLNDEMIEILEHVHSHYVPTKMVRTEDGELEPEVAESIFFGGDQLTEERARNCKDARADADTEYDRLEGVKSKHEDWHSIRLIYQILYDILYKPSSATDQGTMCSNMNITNNVNAKTNNVLDNFNYCKEFVDIETEAYLVAATMTHFEMKSIDDTFVPDAIRSAPKKEQQHWFHGEVKSILEKHVMKRQSEDYDKMAKEVDNLNRPKQRPTFPCSECGIIYVYEKCWDNHLRDVHNIVLSDARSNSKSKNPKKSKKTEVKQDYVYNYACVRLSLGMLIHNFNDAVKEGDGARILLCWKYMLLLFKAHGHTKYSLAALQLLANTKAMLSPEKAHSLIWNRTVNNKGSAGINISLDLRMEHIIHLKKEMLGNLGANLHEPAAVRCSKAIKGVQDLFSSIDSNLNVRHPSGRHTVTRSEAGFLTIVNELHSKAEVFVENCVEGREHHAFPKFNRSPLTKYTLNCI